MSKFNNKSGLGIVIAVVMVVVYGMIFRTPTIGLIIAVAACLKIAAIPNWRRGANYGAIVGAISYTIIGFVKGSVEGVLIPLDYFWAIPLIGIVIGGIGVISGALFGAVIGKIFEMQKERFPWE